MKLDEFAFLNQQLAGMLRAGIPLEGSLRELSRTMQRGKLRDEMEALEADLAAGVPLSEAISKRSLPELYVRLTQAGAAGGDLPGVLILLADYYNRLAAIMTRVKGLMVYPLIVLLASLGVSILITVIYRTLIFTVFSDMDIPSPGYNGGWNFAAFWAPTSFLVFLIVLWTLVVILPPLRNWMRWRLPGFREASLAQIAGAASLLMRSGANLDETLQLLEKTEENNPAGVEINHWMALQRQGVVKWSTFTAESRVFPPLFRWLVAQGGEDLATGFQRASDIYHARSEAKIDLLLFAAMPIAVMFAGAVIVLQMFPVLTTVRNLFSSLGL